MMQTRKERSLRARDKRREELLRAATKVFSRKGYWSASISDVIQAAGVARGTFYLYFRSKRDVFIAIVDDFRAKQKCLLEKGGRERREIDAEKSRAETRARFLTWLEFFFQHRDAAGLVMRDAIRIDPAAARKREEFRGAARSAMLSNIVRRQEDGLYGRNVSSELASHFILGMFDEIAASYLPHVRKADLPWLADQFSEFQFHGLSARKR